ncbi:MAG: tetratricopeptide repeat protein [Parachlamydiaceae bacterium]
MRYLLLIFAFFSFTDQNERLKQLENKDLVAVQEENPMIKEQELNQVFAQYAALERDYQPIYGNGKLYYNLANSYYQLGQYPYALLYYYKALKLRPWDPLVKDNIATVQSEMLLDSPIRGFSLMEYLFLAFLPMPLRFQLLAFCSSLFLLFYSLYLWMPKKALRVCSWVFMVFLIALSLSITYGYYFSPIEGVVTNASYLYQLTNEGLEMRSKLLPVGSRVIILEEIDRGKRLKVTSDKGDLGYLASEVIQVI